MSHSRIFPGFDPCSSSTYSSVPESRSIQMSGSTFCLNTCTPILPHISPHILFAHQPFICRWHANTMEPYSRPLYHVTAMPRRVIPFSLNSMTLNRRTTDSFSFHAPQLQLEASRYQHSRWHYYPHRLPLAPSAYAAPSSSCPNTSMLSTFLCAVSHLLHLFSSHLHPSLPLFPSYHIFSSSYLLALLIIIL
jgi:hypothetical protein